MVTAGTILCLKTTGEKVFVLDVPNDQSVVVRRAHTGESGVYMHKTETFTQGEVETTREHKQRQIADMIESGECQKELMLAEKKLNKELQTELDADAAADNLLEFPAAKKVDPQVN